MARGHSLREYIETLESLVKQYAMPGTAVQRPADARRVAVASAIGTTIEWYDFFIYGTAAAVVFAPQFFPQVSPLAGMLAAFATFAVGFIARPLGGIVMGHFGDRIGRKSTLVWCLLLMGGATFGIGMGEGREGARPDYVRAALEASLRRLQVDTIDLYQIHRPDPSTPIADTLQVLNDAVKAGKVREIGCSNFSAEQMRAARSTPGPRYFASVQNDYSLLKRDAEAQVLPECARTGVAFLPYFPLANGLLTGKYRQGRPFPESSRGKDAFGPKVFTPANIDRVEALIAFSESRGHSLLELAFSWLAARPEISSVIAGAKTRDQVRANSRAASWPLTASDLVELDRILA